MTSLNAMRAVLCTIAVGLALVLQTTVFPHFAWHGVGPDVVLLVVVAGGLARGAHFGMVLGFAAGLLIDLAPPADHVAGRWALALLVVGYVAGRVRQDGPTPLGSGQRTQGVGVVGSMAAVAACSFLGSSVFALSGILLQDPSADIPGLLEVVLVGVVWDLALAPFVLPAVTWVLARLEPGERATAR